MVSSTPSSTARRTRTSTQRRISTPDSEASQDRHRKSRRIARKTGQAGPSGWKHDIEGDGRDLVPPSDVEEYEEWKSRKVDERREDTMEADEMDGTDHALSQDMVPSSAFPRRDKATPLSDSSARSPSTSPTVPLRSDHSQSALDLMYVRDKYGDVEMDGSESSFADDEDDAGGSWPILVSSGKSPPRRSHSPVFQASWSLTSVPIHRTPGIEPPATYGTLKQVEVEEENDWESLKQLGHSPEAHSYEEEGIVEGVPEIRTGRTIDGTSTAKEYEPPPQVQSSGLKDRRMSTPPRHPSLGPALNDSDPATAEGQEGFQPVDELDIAVMPDDDDWEVPYGSIPVEEDSGRPIDNDTPATPTVEQQSNHVPLDPLPPPSPFSTQGPLPSQPGGEPSGTPIIEAQLGPHNVRDWPHGSNSPSGTPTRPMQAPSGASDSNTPSPPPPPRPIDPVTIAQTVQSSPPQAPTPIPPDPALEKFRTARTFRTRTKLQLQPYTKERQIYEAALKRSGLKNGTRAVARVRDISPSEEDNEPEGDQRSSSEAPHEDSERIVIGNTPPTATKRLPRLPKKLVDADFDEYFLEFGTPADETDPGCAAKLQKIARTRLKLLKEEKKRRRQEAEKKRQFEALIRGEVDGLPPISGSDGMSDRSDDVLARQQTLSPPPTVKPPRVRKSTGRVTTYTKKDRIPAASVAKRRSPSLRSSVRLETPTSSHADQEAFGTPIDGLDVPYGNDLAFEYHDPVPTPGSPTSFSYADRTTERQVTTDVVDLTLDHGQEDESSFFVDDMPRPKAAARDGSFSSGSHSPVDPRKKIAGNMLPAFMLRRLEREAADKLRNKEPKPRRATQHEMSAVRPGIAITRRGQANEDGLFDFVDTDGESAPSIVEISQEPDSPSRKHGQRQLWVVPDDSDSSSSQAHEDNAGAQTLARLYDGDFETIIAGKRPTRKKDRRDRTADRRHGKQRRPPLGLAKRVSGVVNGTSKPLYQARLDFPSAEKPIQLDSTSKKRKKPSKAAKRKDRPAIRLEGPVLFSSADFAFADDDDVQSVASAPLTSQHRKTPRTPSRPTAAEHVDVGIGKARSWANFDKFSIDFGISPLPSGLHCHPGSYVGSGRLARLISAVDGSLVIEEEIPDVSTYGVQLRNGMAPAAISSIVSVVLDSTKQAVYDFVNQISSERPLVETIRFFAQYVTSRRNDLDGDLATLRADLCTGSLHLSTLLDGLIVGETRASKESHRLLVEIRLALLDLVVRCRALHSPGDVSTAIDAIATGLIKQLLASRFDHTIRPLKKILKGESESPEIDDNSVDAWIAVLHILAAVSDGTDRFSFCLGKAIDETFNPDETGPIAAERVWFLVFGLCALSQFEVTGQIIGTFIPAPRWSLVRRAIGLIKISHNEEAEERAHIDQLQGRDRYIKVMIARCVRLSAVWKWSFDQESLSIATKDLGIIFKDRQHRNLPTEPPVDYPDFITHYDMTMTAAGDTKQETAFELYLRLVCVAASDVIGSSQSLSEAQQAEKDVQRLIMSIIPVSPVKFNRILPPTLRQVGQLVNRYSTMIAACYFSPALLPWLLANSRKWIAFEQADFESRQVCIRGLMYLAVACRHHNTALGRVIDHLAVYLATLQKELDDVAKPGRPAQAPSRIEIERTMVLIVVCFRQIIQHHSFDPESQAQPVYPDPCLLHESWTGRIFALDLANDYKCGVEVVATIQAFLDCRASALPGLAKQRREARGQGIESLDEYSFGIDFTAVDLAALGGDAVSDDPVQRQEDNFAKIVNSIISPRIYRLLSDMLPLVEDVTISENARSQRHMFINKLTKCWSDCAGVVVVELNSPEGWEPYIGPFGKESWQRIRNEQGRLQVGLQFMLNVATLDPGCYNLHEDIFLSLLFQSIVTHRWTIEHKYLSALLAMHHVLDSVVFSEVAPIPGVRDRMDRTRFNELRPAILQGLFASIPTILASSHTSSSTKTLIYRCINILTSAMMANEKSIDPNRVIEKTSYRDFAVSTTRDLIQFAGKYINPSSVPGLKYFEK